MSAKATRFDLNGRDVESVTVHVNRMGDQVFITISGEKLTKSYHLSLADWKHLVELTEDAS